jgi:hypothetical protein
MTIAQNNRIESIPVHLEYPIVHQIKHIDPTHSIDILAIFALLTGVSKLWRSIGQLRKKGKLSLKLLFPIFSALLAIWKAIAQMNEGE